MPYTPIKLPPAYSVAELTLTHLELVETIAQYEGESGIVFIDMPSGRCRHPHTKRVYNERTFRPLAALGLLDVGTGHADAAVRTTQAGREWAARRRGIR